jgi:3-hydroxyisobutyrate dehydrogenase-like beta-hydroxyacid dehydrogenase
MRENGRPACSTRISKGNTVVNHKSEGEDYAVGIIGLGNMGGAMAQCLTDAGRKLLGYDTRADRADTLGIEGTQSLVELARSAEIILLSLPDSSIVESVVLGELLPHLHSEHIVIDLSTALPASSVMIAQRLHEKGANFIDAGVSGGPRGARTGELTIMAGGRDEDLARVAPVLDILSSRVHHLGGVGSGHTAKVLNNFLNAVNLAATAEVFVAARHDGMDLKALLAVLNESSGVSNATMRRFPSILDGDYRDGNLSMGLMMKDLRLYLELTRKLEVPSMIAPGCMGLFGTAMAMGRQNDVNNRIVDVIADYSGGLGILEVPERAN